MMKQRKFTNPLIFVFALVLLVQLACGLGGNTAENEANNPDYAATEAALQATQAALDAQAQQPKSTKAPLPTQTNPPPTNPPPTLAPTTPLQPTEPEVQTFTSGDLIYFTDFDGPGDWEDGWVHFPISDSDLDYTVYKDDGYMHVEVPDQYSSVYLIYDDLYFERDYADVFVEAGFENLSTHNINNISVVCRASDQGWYEFSIVSGGYWYIYKFDWDVGEYTLIKDGGIPNLDYDAPHVIAAECLGDTFTFYFDGEPLRNATFEDRTFREGQTGVAVYADDWEDVVVEFDYFWVSVP